MKITFDSIVRFTPTTQGWLPAAYWQRDGGKLDESFFTTTEPQEIPLWKFMLIYGPYGVFKFPESEYFKDGNIEIVEEK